MFRPIILANFGPPALCFIRSWGQKSALPAMICIREDSETIPVSRYLSRYWSLNPKLLFTNQGIRIIARFLEEWGATGLTCVDERVACWLLENREYLPSDIQLWLPPAKVIKEVISKSNQIQVAKNVGFSVLPSYLLSQDIHASHFIHPEHYPLCLRPSEPKLITPTFKALVVHSAPELDNFIKKLSILNGAHVIAQPFRNLPNLVVHGTRTLSGVTIGMEGFMVERKFEGLTLTIKPTIVSKELQETCNAFADAFGLVGPYHFEFLWDPEAENAYFLEINQRLGGTTAKVFACGYDEPCFALQAYGIIHRNRSKRRTRTASSKLALMKYIGCTVRNKLTPLDYPAESRTKRLIRAFYGLLFYSDDVFDLKDIQGSLALYLGSLRNNIQRKLSYAHKAKSWHPPGKKRRASRQHPNNNLCNPSG